MTKEIIENDPYKLAGVDINAGNARKNFIKSYSIKNFNNKSYLEVNFEKDLLIEVFNRLSIPILSNSRPIVLFLIEIDDFLLKLMFSY